jgi:thermostable 8-oxoguanine DNA glycosylase
MITSDYYVEGVNENTLTEWELQARLIFSVIVAGKSAKFARSVIAKLFTDDTTLPFTAIQRWIETGILEKVLRVAGTGNYGKMMKCLPDLIKLNPRTCCIEQMEKVSGVGPKTSRFYLLWIGRKIECAALDTHVLKFLGSLGHNVPKSTPSGKKYHQLEQYFLAECRKRGKTPNELDAEVWMAYSSGDQKKIDDLLR